MPKRNKKLKITYNNTGDIMKKIKIIGVIIIFALTVLYHFLYELLPNPIFSIFFPVNESIWEHMKLLYSGILSWGIIEYFILKKKQISYKNYVSTLFITMITSIIIYLIMYLPLYNAFGENMIISITLLIIVIIIEQILSYYLLNYSKENKTLNKVSVLLIVLGYVTLTTLTYNPPRNYIFYDTVEHKYGIDIYK